MRLPGFYLGIGKGGSSGPAWPTSEVIGTIFNDEGHAVLYNTIIATLPNLL